MLYGFGRIGRLVARILAGKTGGGDNLRLRAIVVRPGGDNDLNKRASLLRRDSIHGPFSGEVTVDADEGALIINGNLVHVIYANGPGGSRLRRSTASATPSSSTTRASGAREEDLVEAPAARGPRSVILTAPGKGDVPNIVYGVNHHGMIGVGRRALRCVLYHERDRARAQGGERRVLRSRAVTSSRSTPSRTTRT